MILITSSPVQGDNEYLLQYAEHSHHFSMATQIAANSCQFAILALSMSYLLLILSLLIDLLETHWPNLQTLS